MNRVIPFLIAVVVLAGVADSAYLALRDSGAFGSPPETTASSCFVAGGSCEVAAKSEDSSVLGVPAGMLGAAYFMALLGATAVRIIAGRWLLPWLMVPAFLFGLAYSGYLAHKMVAVLDAVCPYCMAAHCLNAIAFILFVVSLLSDRARLRSPAH
jgi:uncharacterized membrane protein